MIRRVVYNLIYIKNTTAAMGNLRSVLFLAGIGQIFTLFIKSGNLLRERAANLLLVGECVRGPLSLKLFLPENTSRNLNMTFIRIQSSNMKSILSHRISISKNSDYISLIGRVRFEKW